MNNIMPPFFKKIDAWLLLNYPRIWASRIHNFLYILLALMLISALIGFCLPFDFKLIGFYVRDIVTPYFMVGLVVLTVAVLWLTRFRAKIATLNYIESFALTSSVALLVILMFLTPWFSKYGHEKRIAASYDRTVIENDLLISSLLNNSCNFYNVIDTIEDIKVGDYTIKTEETKRIQYNLNALDMMNNTIDSSEFLNSLPLPENLGYEWFKQRNNRILASKIKAIRALKTVPDSLVQIYEMLLNKDLDEESKVAYYSDRPSAFQADVGFETFLYCQLHKISPTWNYLRTKYEQENVSELTKKLGSIYMIQRQQLIPSIMFSSTSLNQYEVSYRAYGSYIGNNNTPDKIEMNQGRVEMLKTSFRDHIQSWNFYELLNQAIWFILILAIPILFIINFGIRHTLFSFLGFIVAISFLQLCFGIFNHYGESNFIPYFMMICIIGCSIFLAVNKDSKHKKWGQFFIPLSILLTFYFVILMQQRYVRDLIYGTGFYYSIESILMNYGIFVLPLLFMTYHKLGFLPKEK
jgi:hypothetical protein